MIGLEAPLLHVVEPRDRPGASRIRAIVVSVLAVGVLSACATLARPQAEVERREEPGFPALAAGRLSRGEEVEALRILRQAREALEAGEWEEAVAGAREIRERYAALPGAGEALWIEVRGNRGMDAVADLDRAATELANLLPDGHPVLAEAWFAAGVARSRQDRPGQALEAFLRVPSGSSRTAPALDSASVLASGVDDGALASLLRALPPGDARAAPLQAEGALRAFVAGRADEARAGAEAALALVGSGRTGRIARAILAGDVSEFRARPTVLGAVLPVQGSPNLREYAERFLEGARLAVAERGGELRVEDSGGDPYRAQAAVDALEQAGALGILGPLTDDAVAFAARGRRKNLPMVSPTARLLPPELPELYSLAAVDEGAPRTLAQEARRQHLRRVVVIRPETEGGRFEARAFVDEFRQRGGEVLRELGYPPGSTFFQESLRSAEALRPEAIVLPIPARDIELLAPQVSFFGLDSLGIRVLGTEAWTDPEVLRAVAPRHTDAVLAVSDAPPEGGDDAGAAEAAFVRLYEETYRKTLRSPVPAIGYDAARLALFLADGVAISGGVETAEAVFEGLTGTYLIRDGRLIRRHYPVVIRNRAPGPVTGRQPAFKTGPGVGP